MMNVRKVHINKENVDFSKPAVIIANHVSFLDILVIVMQHPRLILLTNKWVYHSPVFGKVVQMADYYPVMEGIEPAIDRFESIVEQGYSIVVFPEGTRSVDGKIHRFHKGSFYLAEKLGLDIIPLLLHGTGDTMGKGDFMLFNGTMTMKFLPRIAAGDKTYGANYAEKTKLISAHFKQAYLELKKELETAKYFRQRLIANYNYKGPVLEWKSRMVTREYAVFDTIHKWLPEKGNIVEIGCGYGFYTYMLHFLASTRTWTAIDKDEEKVSLAANCFSKKSNVTFIQGDAGCMDLEPSESILLHDIFRHSTPEDAKVVLHKVLQALLPGGLLIFRFAKADIDTRKASLKLLPEGFEMKDEQQFDKTVLIKVKCN
jgi:1-acyl-sn-glycerol-3-phosphate acyltransferase